MDDDDDYNEVGWGKAYYARSDQIHTYIDLGTVPRASARARTMGNSQTANDLSRYLCSAYQAPFLY